MTGRHPSATLFPYTTLFRSYFEGLIETGEYPHVEAAIGRDVREGFERVARVACDPGRFERGLRSEEHTSELQSRENLVCRLLLEKKKTGKLPEPEWPEEDFE